MSCLFFGFVPVIFLRHEDKVLWEGLGRICLCPKAEGLMKLLPHPVAPVN